MLKLLAEWCVEGDQRVFGIAYLNRLCFWTKKNQYVYMFIFGEISCTEEAV